MSESALNEIKLDSTDEDMYNTAPGYTDSALLWS